MDTITHTLFGIAIYKAVKKENMGDTEKRALLFTAIGASQIPDIDVVSQLWDTAGRYQMWHRGITHSIFLVPLWAFLFFILNSVLFRLRSWRLFFIALMAVFIHDTSDVFNAWGTGYLEPFSSVRLSLGTIPIIDFVIWFIFLLAFIFSKRSKQKETTIYRISWLLIAIHIFLQSVQGYVLHKQYTTDYEQIALAAAFMPWQFSIIAKKGNEIYIYNDSIFSAGTMTYKLLSEETASLDKLFVQNPRAKTLYEWSPFVVIVDDKEQIGIYDPRFYRNGQSFLFEYIEKTQK